ncbi:A24 family peptidase C-terminal domain-containing protein [Salinibaculum rarum]|uniref:A24 family peptidase C-terminal domain-containing protein n=1 Tax=Salinibaculum rarum TaxID=3058903 RepID=UPI00265FDC21|nr:A24 family peptidase C-terminal domain-containing protein [Salinibaculum sp. KK48]
MLRSPLLPDLIRLLALPIFGWAAWKDYSTRRVPNKTWLPIVGLAFTAFLLDLSQIAGNQAVYRETPHFFIATIISITVLIPFGYLAWYTKWLGGADAKAIMVFSFLYPIVPHYAVPAVFTQLGAPRAFPLLFTEYGVFSFTILLNVVIIGITFPFGLAIWNALHGNFSPFMFVGRPVDIQNITNSRGVPIQTFFDGSEEGVDIGVLKKYVNWRETTVEKLIDDSSSYRSFSIGENPGTTAETDTPISEPPLDESGGGDPWGAVVFLQESAFPSSRITPGQLRESLDYLSSHPHETVWISPGIPYMVPIVLGLSIALTMGNLILVFTVYLF